jgi:site-specific DNA recombinase
VRVSTDRQAQNDEGSLKTQLQRLREHLRYKNEVVGEPWEEAAVYELRGVSGKNSVRSQEFERLFADVRAGVVDTVVCTSLDRICRSVADFLHFFEFLNEHGAQFVCLKQQYDTTSPQGRFFVTVMMALAQFEREQTAERTRDATLARSERGLWNGGYLYGYDLDVERKGYLKVNADEAAAVNFAFETYLATGSVAQTVEALNTSGYRTKAYRSRRDVEHPPREFVTSKVQHLLKNPAYVGRKVIDIRGERREVTAVWPGIVDEETFDRVQHLLALNARTNHSQVRAIRHVYPVAGLLRCGRCDAVMVGRSGHGRGGKAYFYYACPTETCGLRAVAPEVEAAVLGRFGHLVNDAETVAALTEKANAVLARARPSVEKRIRSLKRSLRALDGEVRSVAGGLAQATAEAARLVNQQLAELGARRGELEAALAEADRELRALAEGGVTAEEVTAGLHDFERVFEHLQPFEQKELVRLLLRQATLSDRHLTLHLNGKACASFAQASKQANRSTRFAQPLGWLPDLDSNQEHRG